MSDLLIHRARQAREHAVDGGSDPGLLPARVTLGGGDVVAVHVDVLEPAGRTLDQVVREDGRGGDPGGQRALPGPSLDVDPSAAGRRRPLPVTIAHRGSSGDAGPGETAPVEETREAYLAALRRLGEGGKLEGDVQRCRGVDGRAWDWVMMHDTDLNRVAEVDRKVEDCTLAELKALVPGTVSVDEFLELARHRAVIELKSAGRDTAEAVIAAIRRVPGLEPSQVEVDSWDPAELNAAKVIAPDINTSLLKMRSTTVNWLEWARGVNTTTYENDGVEALLAQAKLRGITHVALEGYAAPAPGVTDLRQLEAAFAAGRKDLGHPETAVFSAAAYAAAAQLGLQLSAPPPEPGSPPATLITKAEVVQRGWELLVAGAASHDLTSLSVEDYDGYTADMFRLAHDAGLSVTVWTVDTPERMQALIAAGVDALITDHPDRLEQVKAAIDKANPRAEGPEAG